MAQVEVAGRGNSPRVAVGDEVVIRLEEPATTGYTWQLQGGPGPQLEVVGDDLDAGEPGTAAPGAAARRTLRLAARAPGTVRISLVLRRPWQSDTADRFDVEVTVG